MGGTAAPRDGRTTGTPRDQRERARRLRLDMEPPTAALRTASSGPARRARPPASEPDAARAALDFLRACCARPTRPGQRPARRPSSARPARCRPPARDIARRAARRLRGDYAQDEWGFDEEFVEIVYPLLRVHVRALVAGRGVGVENVPAHGRALLVANHAGVLPWDATMMSVAILKEHPLPRLPALHGARLGVPAAVGERVHAPHRRRGRIALQRHTPARAGPPGDGLPRGRRRAQASRSPSATGCSASGAAASSSSRCAPARRSCRSRSSGREEIYPKLGESRLLARLTGAPYFPITPTFPLARAARRDPAAVEVADRVLRRRSTCRSYGPEAAEDRALVFELSERVRDTIQEKVLREPRQARLRVPLALRTGAAEGAAGRCASSFATCAGQQTG